MVVKMFLHCEHCGKTGKPEDFPVSENDEWYCPRCGMDESGLELTEEIKQ